MKKDLLHERWHGARQLGRQGLDGRAINAPRAIAESMIRITFGPENSAADVDAVLAAFKFALRKQKASAAKMA